MKNLKTYDRFDNQNSTLIKESNEIKNQFHLISRRLSWLQKMSDSI